MTLLILLFCETTQTRLQSCGAKCYDKALVLNFRRESVTR